jgi:tetratricopeptide (TPR) repeat protein
MAGQGEDLGDLLALAFARPREATARADALLANRPSPLTGSFAYQAKGLVERDFGDLGSAISYLRKAAVLGRRSGVANREADALAALGVALVSAGRTRAGLDTLDGALARADGLTAARVRFRRAGVLRLVGRLPEALAELRTALPALRRAGDTIWVARTVTLRGLIRLALGQAARADRDFAAAERMFATTDQEHDSAVALHNRGLVAFRTGDLPLALDRFDEVERRYRALGTSMPELSADRCALLLAAGLPGEALAESDRAIARLVRQRGRAILRAELLLTAAHAALAANDEATAEARARAAARLFRAHGRDWWSAQCALLTLQIRARPVLASAAAGVAGSGWGGRATSAAVGVARLQQDGRATSAAVGVAGSGRRRAESLLREAAELADRLAAFGAAEAADAHLLAGRLARVLGRSAKAAADAGRIAHTLGRSADADAEAEPDADLHLAIAARTRHRGSALTRAGGWLAEALRAEAAGDSRRTLHACRRGLEYLDEHRLTLGAPELRATATAHGAELAALALRVTLAAGQPRRLLLWAERWRATALAVPPVRPPAEPQLQAALIRLRETTARLEEVRFQPELHRERRRLEADIRAATRKVRGPGRIRIPPLDVDGLMRALPSTRMMAIVAVDGRLHVLVCGGGRVERFAAGSLAAAGAEVEHARAALRRLAYPGASPSTMDTLRDSGRRLEDLLLGDAATRLGDAPVVVVPPATLHAVPWAILPSLADRPVSVAPSARAWLRARDARPADNRVVLVRGPGLESDGAEVPILAERYGDATVLEHGKATAANVLEALDGCALAHVAAHGTFRADSPYFSSLRVDDGPLTVHDFELLRRAPYRLVLPSCESGRLAPAGADELLGLATALLPLGTAGIVAGVVAVNDTATVPLMVGLHDELRKQRSLAEALMTARQKLPDDPVLRATAWSFIAVGA